MAYVIPLLIAALVIFLVDKLMSGMSTAGPVTCIKVAVVHCIIGTVLAMVIPMTLLVKPFAMFGAQSASLAIAVMQFVVAAISLMLCDKVLPDFQLGGFQSALVAAVLIAVVRFVLLAFVGI